jgi:hypothetical protein
MNLFRTTTARSSRSLLQLEPLEDRQLLSQAFLPQATPLRTSPTGFLTGSLLLSEVQNLPRTGGAAFMQGSVLVLGLKQPVANEATITDDGRGDVTVEWNGHTPPTFHGVTQVLIDSLGQRDTIKYNLTGNVVLGREHVDVLLAGNASSFVTNVGSFRTQGLTFDVETPTVQLPQAARTSGAAFLVGSVLHVVTNNPGTNQAAIQDDGAGDVTVEWNGHTPPTFHGVSAIVVDTFGQGSTINFAVAGNVTKPQEVFLHVSGNDTFTVNQGGFQTSGLAIKVEPVLAKGP